MSIIDGTTYDWQQAWQQLLVDQSYAPKTRQSILKEEIAKPGARLDAAPFEDGSSPAFPFSMRSIWRTAQGTAFLHFAYQAGQDLPFAAYSNGDPRLNQANEEAYSHDVYKSAGAFLKSKSGLPLWSLAIGAAGLLLVLTR